MQHDRQQGSSVGIQGLFSEALRETTDLARKEFTLFRTEMSYNAKLILAGIVALMVAMVFAIATLVLLTDALVDWVSSLVNSEALGALIVAGVTAVIALAFALWGKSKLSSASLEPTHTIRSVERDSAVLSERMSS